MFSLVLGPLLLQACSENTVSSIKDDENPPAPNILVSPVSLEFGQLMTGEQEVQTFNVRNVGEAALTVSDITIEGSMAYSILSSPGFLLQVDEAVDIELAFTPMGVENPGQAVVWSDDPDEPESLVNLAGFGSVPELRITPDPYDFGTHFVPCGDWTTLTLENVGGDLLVIDSIEHISDGDFVLDDPNVFPLELQPGQFTSVNVTFTASRTAEVTGELHVMSNDPRELVVATQTGAGQYAATLTDTFTIPTNPPVDIMFAVDQSCSMDALSVGLANNFGTFIDQIDQATQGWQIGVPNMDTACFNGGILASTTVGYQAAFESAVVEGYDSSGDASMSERLFDMVEVALGKTAPGQCNSGFLRPGALLHIVLVSDEPSYSNHDWPYYQPIYEQYVSDPSLLKVSTILASGGFGSCGQAGTGYPIAAASTGGLQLDICGNWGTQVDQLATASLQGVNNFELSQNADPNSIVVRVNGVPTTTGWSFNPATNTVVFSDAPDEGSTVDIDFGVAVACSP